MQSTYQIEQEINRLRMREFADLLAIECKHESTELGKYMQSHGQWRVRKFCSTCGQSLSADLKMAGVNLSELKQFDTSYENSNRKIVNDLKNEYRTEIRQLEEQLYKPKDVIESVPDDDDNFWNAYSMYLRSQSWHTMRKAVLKRDNELCQACLTRKATQVHHLSYRLFKEIGLSAAFELVAICKACHEKIHPRMAEEQQKVTGSLYNPYLTGVERVR